MIWFIMDSVEYIYNSFVYFIKIYYTKMPVSLYLQINTKNLSFLFDIPGFIKVLF